MGFRKDAWATCWDVRPRSNTLTTVRISTVRKDRQTGEYTQDFSGFVSFAGTATAAKAARLGAKDRIRLGDVDVTTKYDKEKGVTYTNFMCYSFATGDEADGGEHTKPQQRADEEFDGDLSNDELPF